MELFEGKKVADEILEELRKEIKTANLKPSFAVILVGENEASRLYTKLKKKAAAKVGISVKEYFFDSQASEEEIVNKIKELNKDTSINGIIVQLPLPAVFSTDKIIEVIDPKKDIDGFHKENRRLLERGHPYLMPVLPMAILLTIQAALKNSPRDKKIIALVNSDIFGQVLKTVFKKDGLRLDYIVQKNRVVSGIEKEIRSADVLIMVCGCPNFIKGDVIKENAILIDAGITRFHDGKVMGDIDRESVKKKAAFLTPVPGGIGPLTVALLLRNVYLAAKIRQNSSAGF